MIFSGQLIADVADHLSFVFSKNYLNTSWRRMFCTSHPKKSTDTISIRPESRVYLWEFGKSRDYSRRGLRSHNKIKLTTLFLRVRAAIFRCLKISILKSGLADEGVDTNFLSSAEWDYPLNLSISVSGGKENNCDSLSSCERNGKSSKPNLLSLIIRPKCGLRTNPCRRCRLKSCWNTAP